MGQMDVKGLLKSIGEDDLLLLVSSYNINNICNITYIITYIKL